MAKSQVQAKKGTATPKPVVLEAPRTLDQEPLYNMASTVRSQFNDVYLVDNKGTRIATVVHSTKSKETKIGSANVDFICGLILGSMGGRGNAPGGACIWAGTEASKMNHLDKYTLIAVPDKRGGTLEAPVPVWIQAVSGKAGLLKMSVEKHPLPRRTRETTTGSEEEDVDVWL